MTSHPPQDRDNHVRWHPPFHFFFSPVLFLLLILTIVQTVRNPGLSSVIQLLMVLVLGTVGFLTRTYALKVQDRVIRLEEQIRLSSLMETDYAPTINALSEAQLIALRFASDAELPTLAKQAAQRKSRREGDQGCHPELASRLLARITAVSQGGELKRTSLCEKPPQVIDLAQMVVEMCE